MERLNLWLYFMGQDFLHYDLYAEVWNKVAIIIIVVDDDKRMSYLWSFINCD